VAHRDGRLDVLTDLCLPTGSPTTSTTRLRPPPPPLRSPLPLPLPSSGPQCTESTGRSPGPPGGVHGRSVDAATGYHVSAVPVPHPARLPAVGRNVNAKCWDTGRPQAHRRVGPAPRSGSGALDQHLHLQRAGAAPRLTFASSFVVFLFTSTAHSYPKESRATPSEHTHGHTLGVLPRL
jgi:hypothetical protein